MCLLRGQIHLRLSSAAQAKESFLEALSLDVRCYDAFSALVGGEMMNVEEGEFDVSRSSFFPRPRRGRRAFCCRMGHDTESLLPRANRGVCRVHQDDVHRATEEGEFTFDTKRDDGEASVD